MYNVAIVEDDKQARNLLKIFLNRYAKENNLSFGVTEYADGLNFIENYTESYDLVFMDIEMPMLDGLKTAKKLRDIDNEVCLIFVTNMAQYAIKGYEVSALDFVVKPLEYYNFSLKIKKAVNYIQSLPSTEICLQFKSGFKKIKSDDILYIECIGHELIFHTKDEELKIRFAMSKMEDYLKKQGWNTFSRCNKSFLVNLKHVVALNGNNITVSRYNKYELSIGRTWRKQFLNDLTGYLGD